MLAVVEGLALGLVLSLASFWVIDRWQMKRYPSSTEQQEGEPDEL